MKRQLAHTLLGKRILLMLMACLTMIGCKQTDLPEPEPQPTKARKTIIVYMCAENSLDEYKEPDIREIMQVAQDIPKDCNFVIYVDDAGFPYMQVVTESNPEHKESMAERNSADPKEFGAILDKITTRYPAETYSLVMWSHASGWVPANITPRQRSFGIDNERNNQSNYGSKMDIWDMRKEIQRLGLHFDFILFDACFMQCIESTYELRDVADYIIASPAEIPANGAPYHEIMSGLTGDGEKAVEDIVNKYYAHYSSMNGTLDGMTGLIISAYKTSELDNLLNLTRQLLPDYYDIAPRISTLGVQQYGVFKSSFYNEYFDMGSLMNRLLSGPEYEKWMNQLRRTAVFRQFTNRWSTGYSVLSPEIVDAEHLSLCSFFVPNAKYDYDTNYNEAIKQTQWYQNYVK